MTAVASAPEASRPVAAPRVRATSATRDAGWVRSVLIVAACAFLALFVVVPLLFVFAQALAHGIAPFAAAVRHPETLAAVKLTLLTAAICVPFNTL
jgi:sulfate transport system permease protein